MKSKYQVIYQVSEYENVVFIGSTDLSLDELLNSCEEKLDVSVEATILAVDFQPLTSKSNEQEEKS